jgi:hypothetical protein
LPIGEGEVVGGLVSARRLVALSLGTVGALVATVAFAQEPAPPPGAPPVGNWGGGRLVDTPKSAFGAGNTVIGLRATGDGKVQILADIGARCASATIKAKATVAADGSFSASGVAKEHDGGSRDRTPYKITGVIDGASAGGTASMHSKTTRRGRTASCKSGSVRWEARRADGNVGTPGPAPNGAHFYGTTSQQVSSRHPGIILPISSNGHRVIRVLFEAATRCPDGVVTGLDVLPASALIGADGTFKTVDHYTFRISRRIRLRGVDRVSGTIGSAGAFGTASSTFRYINIHTGHTVEHCRTGTVKWVAAP